MMKGLMDRSLAREKWVNRFKNKAETTKMELDELKA